MSLMTETAQAKRAVAVEAQGAEALRVPVASKPVVKVAANLSPVRGPIAIDVVDGEKLLSYLTAASAFVAVVIQRSFTGTSKGLTAVLSSLLRISFVPRTNAGSTCIFVLLVPLTILRKYSFRGLDHGTYLQYHYTMSTSRKRSSLCQS